VYVVLDVLVVVVVVHGSLYPPHAEVIDKFIVVGTLADEPQDMVTDEPVEVVSVSVALGVVVILEVGVV